MANMASSVTEKVAFPKTYFAENNGWKLTVNCKGVYTEFVYGIAQAGDPKGSVTLRGQGMSVSVGTGWWYIPVNLSRREEITIRLGEELRNKYNREPDWKFLHELSKEAFQPYNKYI